ncbi:MAG TPA: sugar phosphate isomerase/epimerase family protein [Opitutaceae bacterium]|nr:sugar phosphate isomerase/epimerase family protein [Opitutaceae bacterium]HRJ46653.1 sugar phosphate isomerase/epimerase family protein [Opitutaceae bacterium]
MPKLAAFPKAFMQQLCKDGSMTLQQWVDLAAPLGLDGLEYYSGMLELADPTRWPMARRQVEAAGMVIPMLCCSPDFSQLDPELRRIEIEKEKTWIRMAATLGAKYCRVLSGQRRPELTVAQGLDLVVANIEACLPEAEKCGVTLILENHYKDDFWEYPEFAQKMDVFCALVDRLHHPHFGVNYDPSNAFLAGDDPLELLARVKHRVVTMHASDRYLLSGTLEDLRKEEGGALGYAKRLAHGEIGKGLNDYDAIFGTLKAAGFDNWISIEDGVNGMEQLAASVRFVRGKISQYWPAGR